MDVRHVIWIVVLTSGLLPLACMGSHERPVTIEEEETIDSTVGVEPATRPEDTEPRPRAKQAARDRPDSTARSLEIPDIGTRPTGDDWPAFLGPTGDNKSAETGISWPESGLRLVWNRELGIGYGGPSIHRGRLFIHDRHDDEIRLSCFKSETGEEIWRFEEATDYEDMYGYNNGPRATPVVDGDRVYIFGVDGWLHCVRIADGSLVWKENTHERFGVLQNFFGAGSTPVVEGKLLIVPVGGSPASSPAIQTGEARGNGSGIVAFDKLSGAVVYKITDELASYASPRLVTIDGRRWGFQFARGGLVGFEPATGKVDFHYPWRAELLESVNASNPVVVGDEVLISEAYGPGTSVLKVRPGGYDVVWKDGPGRTHALKTHWNTPIYHEGHVYGCSGRHTNEAELRCVEWKTGKVAWTWTVPEFSRSSLFYVDGHFVCLSEYGDLFLFKASSTGFEPVARSSVRDENGRQLLRYPCWAAPVLSHGLLYVRGEKRLVCLELIPEKKEPEKEK